jgi:RNA polymerase sigma-70 factor (ECF subfamily)
MNSEGDGTAGPPPVRPSDKVSPALDAVLVRFAERVRYIGVRHGLTGSDVEDLLQEVRLRLWKALESGEKILGAPASYVHRTAVSAALDVLRRRRARRETPARLSRPSGLATLGQSPAADRLLEQVELQEQVGRAVEQLIPARRSVLKMYLAGYGREEIADLLGWTEPKTRNLLYRGLADLREKLTAMGIGPEALQ